jgi:hypothetical protein
MGEPTVIDPARLAQALGMLARASSEIAWLHDTLQTDEMREQAEALRHAEAYDQSAAVYTRRADAARAASDLHQAADFEKRAGWFRARADVKRAGLPMPAPLRTPKERIDAVGRIREAMIELAALVRDVEPADVVAFGRALVRPPGLELGIIFDQQFFARWLENTLRPMGVRWGEQGQLEVLPFAIAITEPAGVDAAAPAAAPAAPSEGSSEVRHIGPAIITPPPAPAPPTETRPIEPAAATASPASTNGATTASSV